MGATRTSPVLSTVTSSAGKKIPVPKEYMEKIGVMTIAIDMSIETTAFSRGIKYGINSFIKAFHLKTWYLVG